LFDTINAFASLAGQQKAKKTTNKIYIKSNIESLAHVAIGKELKTEIRNLLTAGRIMDRVRVMGTQGSDCPIC
jgi:hypothetical protein